MRNTKMLYIDRYQLWRCRGADDSHWQHPQSIWELRDRPVEVLHWRSERLCRVTREVWATLAKEKNRAQRSTV